MEQASEVLTSARWIVKKGKEDEFLAKWREFAKLTSARSGPKWVYMARDVTNRRLFISFGAWESAESVLEWRNWSKFKEFIEEADELCDEIQTFMGKPVEHLEKVPVH